ncbi:uncharacterized protein si:dkey-229e3.2 [Ictalurus furcatus]|uniref:uncharacterized protein si:dkey-229e3.2 n=1 Tax=Ictalurus furcatus TaxID=66913 RepID=UPI002350A3B6|nr:uncharacterized protein si:dkey-229e3.2 [Ictalurus furcatus]XP_053488519.1 uncharacterized protein si:dkey-229e3.2 [Ictalurus furcatus]
MKCECAAMEKLGEDGFERCEQFEDWSSSEHWDEDHRDSSGFGDWASFKDGLSEESDSADLLSQEGQTSGHEHKVERGDEPWIVIHDCFHVEEIVRDTDMMDFLPLSQLLHNSTHTPPPPAVLLRKGASFYHSLLCEPKSSSVTGPKPNLHSHKQLTDTLQLKQSNTSQNTDLLHLGFEKPQSSSAALIQTKLTAPTWCQTSPGFFYQISHRWLSQNSLRLQNNQDNKKDLL